MAKNHRQNHDFQILYFLIGGCHTADGAYSLLCDLYEDREVAFKNVTASKLRENAKIIRANRKIKSNDEAEQLEGKADLAEIEAFSEQLLANINACQDEMNFIKKCKDEIEPYRQYSHLSLSQAHEACQLNEWKLELIRRAENYLLTTGTIPPDHFATMRTHPDFASQILPSITYTKELIQKGVELDVILSKTLLPSQNVIALLENKE